MYSVDRAGDIFDGASVAGAKAHDISSDSTKTRTIMKKGSEAHVEQRAGGPDKSKADRTTSPFFHEYNESCPCST